MQNQPPKQRIRGPELEVLMKGRFRAVPFVEGLMKANKENRIIASNKGWDKKIISNEWSEFYEIIPCWTGTIIAYVEPDKKLGEKIEYKDPRTDQRWVFPVPKEHQDRENAILVAEHPNYELEIDGKNIVVHAKNPDIVLAFPSENDYYLVDPKHGIPYGKTVSRNNEGARYLGRTDKKIGPVARCCVPGYWRVVALGERPSKRFGVVVETNKKNERTVTADNLGEEELLTLCGKFVEGATKITEAEFITKIEKGIVKLEKRLPDTEPEKQEEMKAMIKTLKEFVEKTKK